MGRSLRRAKRSRPKVRVGVEKKRKNVKAPQPVELKLTGTTEALAAKLPKLVVQKQQEKGGGGGGGGGDEPTAEAATAAAVTPWDPSRPLTTNYAAAGVAADANAGYGRNSRPDVLGKKIKKIKKKEQEREEDDDGDNDAAPSSPSSSSEQDDGDGSDDAYSTDDDLRAASGLPRRHSERPPPPKLTATQERVISALRRAHGDDVGAMVKDSKLNRMLLPASKLRKMIEADDVWGRRGGSGEGAEKGRGRCGFRMPKKSL